MWTCSCGTQHDAGTFMCSVCHMSGPALAAPTSPSGTCASAPPLTAPRLTIPVTPPPAPPAPPVACQSAQLSVARGNGLVACFDLTPGQEVLVGRELDSDLYLADRTVSRRHCLVRWDGGSGGHIEDLGSTHGTLVNGVMLAPGSPLIIRVGDQLEVGPDVLLRVESRP